MNLFILLILSKSYNLFYSNHIIYFINIINKIYYVDLLCINPLNIIQITILNSYLNYIYLLYYLVYFINPLKGCIILLIPSKFYCFITPLKII